MLPPGKSNRNYHRMAKCVSFKYNKSDRNGGNVVLCPSGDEDFKRLLITTEDIPSSSFPSIYEGRFNLLFKGSSMDTDHL